MLNPNGYYIFNIMILGLVIWIFKKYIAPRINLKALFRKAIKLKLILTALILTFSFFTVYAAESVRYKITRNGTLIGQLSLETNQVNTDFYLKITSNVSTRFIVKVNVQTVDSAYFKSGLLISSSVSRRVNGDQKDLKKTKWVDNHYQTQCGNKRSVIKQSIYYNMMLMYLKEPGNINYVYSDNFQCFVPITKIGVNDYRIKLPDGNYNDYHFEHGVCTLIIINHSIYTIKMEKI
jgi:hypothetical protein